ncbi:MAG TPA: sulfatase [Kofleriaceae bacterium]|nr:sulfatase [Kofleriaceae bacterium]
MSRPPKRQGGFLASSAFASLLAAGAAGASEAVADHGEASEALAATGFVLIVGAPVGFALVCLGRLLWRAWRPAELVAAARDPVSGGAPRVAAWIAFVALAAGALASLTLQVMVAVNRATASLVAHVLAAPIAAVAIALLLAALSRPSVDLLARLAEAADRRLRRPGSSLYTPRRMVAGAIGLAAGLCALAWFAGIRPHIGHYDLSFAPALLLYLALLAAGPAAWARLERRRWRAGIALALAVALAAPAVGSALRMRHRRPLAMMGIWGHTQVAGLAIDWLYQVEALRGEVELEGIRPPPRPGAPPRDVVLVTIDTVRADRTPPYGGLAAMPALTGLAGRGAVFQWAFSPGNVTRRSLPSMMLGLTPARVSGRVAGWALRLDPRHVLLAERLRSAGHETAGFFCCASQFGPEHQLGLTRGIQHLVIERSGERLARQAARWLAERDRDRGARPLFLWLHFIEPHGWEEYPAADGARRVHRYDLALADVDRALAAVLESAWAPTRRDRTYVVVTSDHGEGLGDHGTRNHSATLYNSEIRVPLVVAGPGIQPRRIARPVGTTDLAPTIIDLAGFAPPGMPAMDGVSLAPLLRGEPPRGPPDDRGEAYAAMIADRSVATSARALMAGRHKLIWREEDGIVELYDLPADPGELRDLAARLPDVKAGLMNRLKALRALEQTSPF